MKRHITLNPSYSLRQDGNRVVLHGIDNEQNRSQEWFSFIHPYYAMLLAFFSVGAASAEEKIKACSSYFGTEVEYIESVISPLIDNDNSITVRSAKGIANSFPKNLLIASDLPIYRKNSYTADYFKYKGIPDYDTNRLEFPLTINLELTMKCYTDCCYCYADRRMSENDMLPTSRIVELILEARNNGVVNFDINGGEVLLHPDIKLILKELTNNGFSPLVSTKIPVRKEILDFFKSIDLKKFQISLDSIDEDVLSRTLKTPKGYIDRIRATLDYASQIGLQIDINSVLTKYNIMNDQLESLFAFTSSYGCVKRHRLNPTGYSLYKGNFEEIAPNVESLQMIESKIPQWKTEFGLDINLSYYECGSQFSPKEKREKFPGRALCTGNIWNMVILPNGDVTICEELYYKKQFIIGNLKNESIGQVWNGDKARELYEFAVSSKSKSACGHCQDFITCRQGKGICWKTVLMAYGDSNWDFPDPRCPKAPMPYNKFYYQ